jgi:hypothetical protein
MLSLLSLNVTLLVSLSLLGKIAMKGFMKAGLFPINQYRFTKSIKLEPSKVIEPYTETQKLQQVIASDKKQQKSDQASSFNVAESSDKS